MNYKVLAISFLLFISMLSTLGCVTHLENPPQNLTNVAFNDTYTAPLLPSTPQSATANFPDKDIVTSSGEVLARLRNVKVTLLQTVAVSGAPVWRATLTCSLDTANSQVLQTSGDKGLKFDVMLLNQADGEIGDWITTSELVTKICGSSTITFSDANDFYYDVFQASKRARIDINLPDWRTCR